jgi:hypothetical protein
MIGFVTSAIAQGSKPSTNVPAVTATKTNVPVLPPKSVFTQPSNAHDGHDPFFPESNRVFDSNVAVAHASEAVTTLTVKGYSIVRGRPMVIINNHSFMVGDEGDVLGAGGGRAHVHCLDINNGTVVVELNGARHELHY